NRMSPGTGQSLRTALCPDESECLSRREVGRSRKRKPRRKPGRACRRPGETTGRRLPGSGEAGALRASLFLAGLALEGRVGADLAGGAGGARRAGTVGSLGVLSP